MRFRLSTRYGMNTALLIALAVGIVAILGGLSFKNNWRKDFTENKRHSLSEQTLNVLGDLDGEVKVTAFLWEGSQDYETARDIFDLYKYESDLLNVELIDPDLNPGLAVQYEIGNYKPPVVFFEMESGRETITVIDEEQVTNALIKLSRGEKKAVYFLEGHGERPLDETGETGLAGVKKLLEDKSYDPRPLLLLRAEKVPDDCAILVVCGPEQDLIEPELDAIRKYIEIGGRALFFIDPEGSPSLTPFLAAYGILLGDDIVVDRLSRLFGGDYLMPVPTAYSDHPITARFNTAPFFPLVRSVSPGQAPGARISWLIKTGDRSWAETDIEALKAGDATLDDGVDTPGPISLAVVSEIESAEEIEAASHMGPIFDAAEFEQGRSAVVVFGDSDFVTNARINLSGNAELFMNTIHWLGREENLIAISPRKNKSQPLVLTASEAKLVFVLPVLLLPGMVLAFGIFVFLRRSRHP